MSFEGRQDHATYRIVCIKRDKQHRAYPHGATSEFDAKLNVPAGSRDCELQAACTGEHKVRKIAQKNRHHHPRYVNCGRDQLADGSGHLVHLHSMQSKREGRRKIGPSQKRCSPILKRLGVARCPHGHMQ